MDVIDLRVSPSGEQERPQREPPRNLLTDGIRIRNSITRVEIAVLMESSKKVDINRVAYETSDSFSGQEKHRVIE